MQQLQLFNQPSPVAPAGTAICDNHVCYPSNACVPGGLFCMVCKMIVVRDMPPAENEPELIGYVTANWAWKYRDGKDWTVDSDDQAH